jgi:hypothetical protein
VDERSADLALRQCYTRLLSVCEGNVLEGGYLLCRMIITVGRPRGVGPRGVGRHGYVLLLPVIVWIEVKERFTGER